MRENNRFRFTGGAAIQPFEPQYPIQGTEGMTPREMQAAGQAAAAQGDAAGYARMQYGQAQNQPYPDELEARELMAQQALTSGMSPEEYKKALIEMLFGGWNTSGLQK